MGHSRSVLQKPARKRTPRISSAGLYALLVATVVLLMVFERGLGARPVLEAQLKDLSEFEKKQLDVFTDMNKLLTTLATGLIAAITGVLLNREKNTSISKEDFRRVIAGWTLAATSLYFGHLTSRQIIWMLQAKFFNLFNDEIWWPARAQFWTFLVSAVLLADFVYRSVRRQKEEADAFRHS